jgi:prevent-host-death family protein
MAIAKSHLQTDRSPASGGKKEFDVGLSTNEIRNNFSETLSRIAYGKARIALTRRGKVLAFFLPAEQAIVARITAKVASTDARDNLSEVLNRVHYGKEVIGIERHDTTVAVVISPDAYNGVISQQLDKEQTTSWSAIADTPPKVGSPRVTHLSPSARKTPKP